MGKHPNSRWVDKNKTQKGIDEKEFDNGKKDFYDIKAGHKVAAKDVKIVTLSNGRRAERGISCETGNPVFRIIS